MTYPMTRPPPAIVHPDPEAEKKYTTSLYTSSFYSRGSDHYYRERPGQKGEWASFSDSKVGKRSGLESNDFWDMDSAYWQGDEYRPVPADEGSGEDLFDPALYDREADGEWDDDDTLASLGNGEDLGLSIDKADDTIHNPVEVADMLPLEPPKVTKTPFEGLPILGIGLVVQSAVEACHAFDSFSYVHLLPINKVEDGFDVEVECERDARFIAYGRFVPGGCVIHRVTQLAGLRDGEPF